MEQQVHPERKEQGQPRIITAGKGGAKRCRHPQNQFFGSHGGKPQGSDPVEMRKHGASCGKRRASHSRLRRSHGGSKSTSSASWSRNIAGSDHNSNPGRSVPSAIRIYFLGV
jgi:hypothetical protein